MTKINSNKGQVCSVFLICIVTENIKLSPILRYYNQRCVVKGQYKVMNRNLKLSDDSFLGHSSVLTFIVVAKKPNGMHTKRFPLIYVRMGETRE